MIRVRFKTQEEDYRPINWPVKHPYWVSGSGSNYWVLVAYADDEAELLRNWPEAYDLVSQHASRYVFTDRFPEPDWWEVNQ